MDKQWEGKIMTEMENEDTTFGTMEHRKRSGFFTHVFMCCSLSSSSSPHPIIRLITQLQIENKLDPAVHPPDGRPDRRGPETQLGLDAV